MFLKKGFAPGMPVRTVSTFIPPVAAKFHSELSGSLTPTHPHLPVHESSPQSFSGLHRSQWPSPPTAAAAAASAQGKQQSPRHPPRSHQSSTNAQRIADHRVSKPEPSKTLPYDGSMEASTITTFIPVKRDPNAKEQQTQHNKASP